MYRLIHIYRILNQQTYPKQYSLLLMILRIGKLVGRRRKVVEETLALDTEVTSADCVRLGTRTS